MSLRRITSGIENFVEMQLFRNLFHSFFYTFSSQFRLTIFVDSQTDKVVIISQTFLRFEVVARGWPVTNDSCAARFNDVADGA